MANDVQNFVAGGVPLAFAYPKGTYERRNPKAIRVYVQVLSASPVVDEQIFSAAARSRAWSSAATLATQQGRDIEALLEKATLRLHEWRDRPWDGDVGSLDDHDLDDEL